MSTEPARRRDVSRRQADAESAVLGSQPERWPFGSWIASYEASVVPLAMGPVAFGAATLGIFGSPRGGAGLVCAMLGGQLLFVAPLGKITKERSPNSMLRILLLAQALALLLLAFTIHQRQPLWLLIGVAILAGAPMGVTWGLYRLILVRGTGPSKLVRRVAISLSVNEIVFMASPIVASLTATHHAVLPILIMAGFAALSAALVTLLPSAPAATGQVEQASFFGATWVWLLCMFLGSAALSAVEVGAVSIAIELDWSVAGAGVIAASVCLTSGLAGAVVSWRNARSSGRAVFTLLGTNLLGTLLVFTSPSPISVLVGCMIIGFGVAPLSTFISILVQDAVNDTRLARAMSILRAAQGLGIMFSALLFALLPVRVAGFSVAAVVISLGLVCLAARPRSDQILTPGV